MRAKLRPGHYSLRTEQAYVGWVFRFVRFHRLRHPAMLGEEDVPRLLHHLAKHHQVAAATQEEALCALLFLYKHVLGRPLRLAGRIARVVPPPVCPTFSPG